MKGPTEVKGPTGVNFEHGGGQKTFRSLRSRTYPLLSHFQTDGAAVEYSTLVLLQIQLAMLLELKMGRRKGMVKE